MTEPLPLPPSLAAALRVDPALVTLACADEQAAYARWIAGELVICMCGDPLTRSGYLGRRADLDPTDPEPEGMWIHEGGYYAGHPERPLLIADLSPPCTVHKAAAARPTGRPPGTPYQLPSGHPGDGQPRYRFGPALTGPFDTWPPLRRRIWARLTRRFRRG